MTFGCCTSSSSGSYLPRNTLVHILDNDYGGFVDTMQRTVRSLENEHARNTTALEVRAISCRLSSIRCMRL